MYLKTDYLNLIAVSVLQFTAVSYKKTMEFLLKEYVFILM